VPKWVIRDNRMTLFLKRDDDRRREAPRRVRVARVQAGPRKIEPEAVPPHIADGRPADDPSRRSPGILPLDPERVSAYGCTLSKARAIVHDHRQPLDYARNFAKTRDSRAAPSPSRRATPRVCERPTSFTFRIFGARKLEESLQKRVARPFRSAPPVSLTVVSVSPTAEGFPSYYLGAPRFRSPRWPCRSRWRWPGPRRSR
jgi:hypothetical protein